MLLRFKVGYPSRTPSSNSKLFFNRSFELSGGSIPPVLFTLERAFERFELVLAEHQKVLHAQMVRDTNARKPYPALDQIALRNA